MKDPSSELVLSGFFGGPPYTISPREYTFLEGSTAAPRASRPPLRRPCLRRISVPAAQKSPPDRPAEVGTLRLASSSFSMKDMPEPCSDVAGRLILEWQVRAPTELPTSASSSFSMKDRRIPPCLCRSGLAELRRPSL